MKAASHGHRITWDVSGTSGVSSDCLRAQVLRGERTQGSLLHGIAGYCSDRKPRCFFYCGYDGDLGGYDDSEGDVFEALVSD